MMIPYLDRVGVGLCLSQEAASMVVWQRRFGRVRLREETLVPLGEDPVGALRALRDASPHPFVHVAVPDALLACEVVPVPDFDESEDRDAWAISEAERRRTQSISGEDLVVTAHVFEVPVQSESDAPGSSWESSYGAQRSGGAYAEDIARYRAVLCVANRARIEDALHLLREAGFVIERVASGLVEAATFPLISASYSGDHQEYGPEASAGYTLPRVEMRNPGVMAVAGAFGTAELEVAHGRPRLVTMLAPAAGEDTAYGVLEVERFHAPPEEDGVPIHSNHESLAVLEALHSSSAMAAAIAYEALYPGLVLVQVLPEAEQQGARRTRRVEEGKRSTLLVAFVVLVLLVLLMGTELAIGALSDRTTEHLRNQAPALALLERDRAEVARMERDVSLAKRAQAERTMIAYYLEALARAVPEDVTLTEVVIGQVDGVTSSANHEITDGDNRFNSGVSGFTPEKNTNHQNIISYVIRGESRTGSAVGLYSLGLGKLDFVAESRVISVTQVSPRALRRQQRDPGERLFSFELAGRVAPPARADSTQERSARSP